VGSIPSTGTNIGLASVCCIGETRLEGQAAIEVAKNTLLSAGLILAIGTVTGLLAQKINIPDVAVFPIVGMLIGPEALALINIKADSALNQVILLFGASYILFDGGASLRFNVLKQVWITIIVLATIGVVITAVLTGMAAYARDRGRRRSRIFGCAAYRARAVGIPCRICTRRDGGGRDRFLFRRRWFCRPAASPQFLCLASCWETRIISVSR
jgi:Sodium/hydrogen exchanger family